MAERIVVRALIALTVVLMNPLGPSVPPFGFDGAAGEVQPALIEVREARVGAAHPHQDRSDVDGLPEAGLALPHSRQFRARRRDRRDAGAVPFVGASPRTAATNADRLNPFMLTAALIRPGSGRAAWRRASRRTPLYTAPQNVPARRTRTRSRRPSPLPV